ncbi:hypothetical protein DFJ73DRAFT_415173 [Zopfochytrium polystomum]|nr:hypothetical protein DFJ73DRAFT_415173 [Zopfochytrium polystomum]
MESCFDCTFTLAGRVISSSLEACRCERTAVQIRISIQTIQVDMCNMIKFSIPEKSHFGSLVFNKSKALGIQIDEGSLNFATSASSGEGDSNDEYQYSVSCTESGLVCHRVDRLGNIIVPSTPPKGPSAEAKQVWGPRVAERSLAGSRVWRSLGRLRSSS